MVNRKEALDDFRDIIDACISGDHRAPEKLYRQLAPQMFGVCLRYAKDREEAEDNLHDGFVTVFSKLKDFRHEGSFEGWVRRIMVNISINRYRQKQQLVLVDEERKLDSVVGEEVALGSIPMEELVRVIQELPPRYRMVFNLYVMEGYSHTEISRELGITEGASRSNLSRAREILRAKLQQQYSEFLVSRKEEI
ncbi:MAG TPA: sigma-70 family RNA polymerase sigma factor [Prolixibacteraceae bacterium]|nr:sigma-70 family RNA polymerase sigma factor [Bacteroidales bacterium]HNQ37157.1 sigma-70 family RNA polymerase sigma factor [Prolixibacteraceae bacterium]HOY50732.1 sigma-70 family RNA polymerase sigma factor [Prolixibacteraceae bacterium]HPJ78173.1 sigma-70 family RNA polymerase sigma factor [Prolixibacteraceae bacterium]HRV89880.1 sigma-70 family RNA polymerase sigma factor [Prolixibacteraceae bacterium]